MRSKIILTLVSVVLLIVVIISIFLFNKYRNQNDPNFVRVSRSQVIELMISGKIKGGVTNHQGNLVLDLKDNDNIMANDKGVWLPLSEMSADDFMNEVKKCGEPCKNLGLGME